MINSPERPAPPVNELGAGSLTGGAGLSGELIMVKQKSFYISRRICMIHTVHRRSRDDQLLAARSRFRSSANMV